MESDRKVVEQVAAIATAREVPRAQVALAWLFQKSVVTAPDAWAPPSRSISTMRSLGSRWTSPTPSLRSSRHPTCRTPSPAINKRALYILDLDGALLDNPRLL